MTKRERAILAVLAYSAQFYHPLSEREIWQRLITNHGFSRLDEWLSMGREANEILDRTTLRMILRELLKKKKVLRSRAELAGAFRYSLVGYEDSFSNFKEARAQQQSRQPIIDEFLRVVKKIPWIKAVVVTGSLAAGGGKPSDDVDFMIITQKNRLWLTRFVLLIISWGKGRRPPLGKDLSKSWDLNLWLDEANLAISPKRQSLYEAYEIFQTSWIYDVDSVEQRFLKQNTWIADYLGNWKGPSIKEKLIKKRLGDGLFVVLNLLAYYLQIGYRTVRYGKQQTTLGTAFFHRGHTRTSIFRRWKRIYNKVVK